ncbi:MAG: alpha/beta hydrolase [Deltaproteobacteria bacterium]|nr:alpha/beta hydrolase [Deltaproteobacteria bacterium]
MTTGRVVRLALCFFSIFVVFQVACGAPEVSDEDDAAAETDSVVLDDDASVSDDDAADDDIAADDDTVATDDDDDFADDDVLDDDISDDDFSDDDVADDDVVDDDLGDDDAPDPIRYKEFVFDRADVERDVVYGSNISQAGRNYVLKMDVYEGEGDTAANRPLIIMAHGSGGTTREFSSDGDFFARSGYVFASIDYRLADTNNQYSDLFELFDGIADIRAAVRFFRKHQNDYRIDPDNIFIGGFSAGAVSALHSAYMTKDREVLKYISRFAFKYVEEHGGLDGDSGNPGYSSEVKGVINVAGGIVSTDLLDRGEPMIISVHGTDDKVIPFYEGISTEGSGLIHPVADALGIPNKLIAIQNGGHETLDACALCPTRIRSFLYDHL